MSEEAKNSIQQELEVRDTTPSALFLKVTTLANVSPIYLELQSDVVDLLVLVEVDAVEGCRGVHKLYWVV